jgi:predicted dehydrogenase
VTKIRTAVIGAGHLGKIHARLLKQADGVELVAVADPSPAARSIIESELSIPTVEDYRTLDGKIEAAIIATPTSTHMETALWCLEHGAHCFVEKPLVQTARHADLLVHIAKRRSRILQVGHVERFNPAWQAVSPLLHRPLYFEAHRTSTYTGRSTDIGVVFDLMVHDLDLILSVVDSKVTAVEAIGQAVLGKFEDWAEARLKFENGSVARLFASRISPKPARTMQLVDVALTADLDFAKGTCELVEASQPVRDGTFQADALPDETRRALHQELFTRWLPQRTLSTTPVNAIQLEHQDFLRAIETSQRPIVHGESARTVIEIAEMILDSIVESTAVRQQSLEAEQAPSIIPAAHRFGSVRRAS